MKKVVDLGVGDPITRVMNGWRDELWRDDGIVVEVSEAQVVCMVYVDVPRRMVFDRQTGVHVEGRSYGWIDAV